jgi:hypothetical protein
MVVGYLEKIPRDEREDEEANIEDSSNLSQYHLHLSYPRKSTSCHDQPFNVSPVTGDETWESAPKLDPEHLIFLFT